MTEEKLKLKRVTGGKFHNRSLVFHFEMDETFLDTGLDFPQNRNREIESIFEIFFGVGI